MANTFEDLVAFQRAVELMVAVYRISKAFPADERFGLTMQIRKAALSVVSNIAEAKGRLMFGERRQRLSDARGSLYEVDAQLIAAKELAFLDDEPYVAMRELVQQTARPLAGLIEYVRRRERNARRSATRPRRPSPVAGPP